MAADTVHLAVDAGLQFGFVDEDIVLAAIRTSRVFLLLVRVAKQATTVLDGGADSRCRGTGSASVGFMDRGRRIPRKQQSNEKKSRQPPVRAFQHSGAPLF
jgi:hypothetical protein